MDRNTSVVNSAGTIGVALRKESVDRNMLFLSFPMVAGVALRKESVDRNSDGVVSGSADYGRSPQGERG